MHSAFMRDAEKVREGNKSWLWMKKGYLKKETEGLIMATDNEVLGPNLPPKRYFRDGI